MIRDREGNTMRLCGIRWLFLFLYFWLCFGGITVEAQTSDLWGQGGERWAGSSILPDFSYAGYHFGEQEIPTPQVKANVLNFGAKGDGKTDDTMAFVKLLTL